MWQPGSLLLDMYSIQTKDERLKVLKDKFPDNCTNCGFKHDAQKCSSMSECPDDSCNLANGKHYKLSCPKFVQSKPISVTQVSVSPYIVNEDNVIMGLNPDYVGPHPGGNYNRYLSMVKKGMNQK